MNRLGKSTSPYLLQHADNPVHWWEWSPEAFEEAKRRNVPVLLSVGYAACHWCHVMAHESFEDSAVAELMNEHFVNIKVDREERPDVDAVYMAATQAMTGHGGWPMTAFLTPDAEPFYCGTYYPPTPRPGMPSFSQLLTAIADAWRDRGDEVRETAQQILGQLKSYDRPLPEGAMDLDQALWKLADEFDSENAGFGGAPKFPPSMVLEFLLCQHGRTGSATALDLAERTCEAMARGGMYDQLGGGFARYSVDAGWVVPHFEKMLYDNALLLRVYAHLSRVSDTGLGRRIAEETAGFLLRDLRTPQGGFAAALDADTEGVEGLTYAWTPAQLTEVLGAEDGGWAASLLKVTADGTFEEGMSTLQLHEDPADPDRWQRIRVLLLAARDERPQPARDDKVVTAWNGQAITALAEAGAVLGHAEWIAAAAEAAELLLDLHVVDGRLRRTSRDGVAGQAAGVLEDYGCLADGLLTLHQVTGQSRWLDRAVELLDIAVDRFADERAAGSFYDTADDAEALVQRPADSSDNASPSGASALTGALLTASVLVGPDRATRYRDLVDKALSRASTLAGHAPRFAGHWLTAAEAAESGPLQVAIVVDPDGLDGGLLSLARASAPGGTVIVAGQPGSAPLLADRDLVDGKPAAYVCRGYVCDRPVTDPDDLSALLR
ncbi:thioredoxin domain-containing protein [Pseudonocardiaceae bacterium YIM PH 21723]|nr:thioredoxin domain-containing protein [Pseudonocardiaceae bacterium YIM PH 21723]